MHPNIALAVVASLIVQKLISARHSVYYNLFDVSSFYSMPFYPFYAVFRDYVNNSLEKNVFPINSECSIATQLFKTTLL